MAIAGEELARNDARIEAKQDELQSEQIALRERQTKVEETDKRILDQLVFIREEIKTLANGVDRRFDALEKRIDRVDTKDRWIISTLVASLIAGGILGFNMLNYFFK